jgi:glycosyltransferase involved in cell wall biosynthesis
MIKKSMLPKLSLCLTVYNRFDEFQKTLSYALSDSRIDEVVISDDCSKPEFQEKLKSISHPKVKLFFNEENFGPFKNKTLTIKRASNDWILLFDSDDVLTIDYLNALEKIETFNPKILYCPEYGVCVRNGKNVDKWDFTVYLGEEQTLSSMVEHARKGSHHCSAFLNTCVYIANKNEYLKTVEPYLDIVFYNDAIHLKYIWLNSGNSCVVIPNMFYYHYSGHRTSFYWSFIENNKICGEEIMKSLVDGTPYNFELSRKK